MLTRVAEGSEYCVYVLTHTWLARLYERLGTLTLHTGLTWRSRRCLFPVVGVIVVLILEHIHSVSDWLLTEFCRRNLADPTPDLAKEFAWSVGQSVDRSG